MEEENVEELYDDLEDSDLGEKIQKLERVNEQLKVHIRNLESDIAKLMKEVIELKKTQGTLTKNISELFNTARAELERKDFIIADLRAQLDDVILRRVGRKRIPPKGDFKGGNNQKRMKFDDGDNDAKRGNVLEDRDDKRVTTDLKDKPSNEGVDGMKNIDRRCEMLDKKDNEHRKRDSDVKQHEDRKKVVNGSNFQHHNIGKNQEFLHKNDHEMKTKDVFDKQFEDDYSGNRSDDKHRKYNSRDDSYRKYREEDCHRYRKRNTNERRGRNFRNFERNMPRAEINHKSGRFYPHDDNRRSRSNSREDTHEKWRSRALSQESGNRNRRENERQDPGHNSRYSNTRDQDLRHRLLKEQSARYNDNFNSVGQNKELANRDNLKNNREIRKRMPEEMEEGEISIVESSEEDVVIVPCEDLPKVRCDKKTPVDKEEFKMVLNKTHPDTQTDKSTEVSISKTSILQEILTLDKDRQNQTKLDPESQSFNTAQNVHEHQNDTLLTNGNINPTSQEEVLDNITKELPNTKTQEVIKNDKILQEVNVNVTENQSSTIVNGEQVAIRLEHQSLHAVNGSSVPDPNCSLLNDSKPMVANNFPSQLSTNIGLNTPSSMNMRRKRRRCVVQLND